MRAHMDMVFDLVLGDQMLVTVTKETKTVSLHLPAYNLNDKDFSGFALHMVPCQQHIDSLQRAIDEMKKLLGIDEEGPEFSIGPSIPDTQRDVMIELEDGTVGCGWHNPSGNWFLYLSEDVGNVMDAYQVSDVVKWWELPDEE